ncbi:MAG: sporulation protein YqfC [Clostridiaceae bacterium]|nr:sporulation protein YqfC [Clostridiaceae bacterium]
MKKDIKSIKEKVSEILELPREVVLNAPRMVFIGNKDVTIENYKGIIEYNDTVVRINTNTHMLRITGQDLEIKNITSEEIILSGIIYTVEFIA